MKIKVTPSVQQYNIQLGVVTPTRHHMEVGTAVIVRGNVPHYEGEYQFTPTEYEQVIPVYDLVCDQNITIDPIPTNYGKITWNGSVLTVS